MSGARCFGVTWIRIAVQAFHRPRRRIFRDQCECGARLHPKSEDPMEAGMVFNVEPAIYFEGYGGIRHCDMVAITKQGMDLLTPFQSTVEELVVND